MPNARRNSYGEQIVAAAFLTSAQSQWLKRLPTLFEIPVPDPARLRRRIELMEAHLVLPVKAVFIGMIAYSFNYQQHWVGEIISTQIGRAHV